MNTAKVNKPIHLRCPKCGHDFSYNANHIEGKIDELKCEIATIIYQLAEYKKDHSKDDCRQNKWYKRLIYIQKRKTAELQDLKKARKAVSVEIKLQQFQIYRNYIKEELGIEKELELIKKAEEDMIYYDYDVAKQSFTKIHDA